MASPSLVIPAGLMEKLLYLNTRENWKTGVIGSSGPPNRKINHYKKVIQLYPDLPEGHEAYAEYLDDLGRFEQGMKEHQRAQNQDPNGDHLSTSPLTQLAVRLARRHVLPQSKHGEKYSAP